MRTEFVPHIIVRQNAHQHSRTYMLNYEVCTSERYSFGYNAHNYGWAGDPGDIAKSLSKALAALPGVESGWLEQYGVTVCIGEAFDWADIGPLILGAIITTVFPEVTKSIQLTARVSRKYYARPSMMLSGDDGMRIEHADSMTRVSVALDFNIGRPAVDIEEAFTPQRAEEAFRPLQTNQTTEATFEPVKRQPTIIERLKFWRP